MSFTVDANILLYASDERSAYQSAARSALDEIAASDEIVYLFWPALMAYLRLATHPSVFERPLALADALDNIEHILSLPNVETAGEQGGFWSVYRRVVTEADIRGNLVSDGQLIALMLDNGIRTIWTHDRDFRRFRGIRIHDPFV